MSEKHPYTIFGKPGFSSSSLIVGWAQDAGKLGARVIDYLNGKLSGRAFGEIEPTDFFALGGVAVENDVAQFPEAKFYCCPESGLVLFLSDLPAAEWYRFLDLVLDVAERYCNVKEVYSVGGMFSYGVHTARREMFAIANSVQMKQVLLDYELAGDTDYETPPGQRPTLSSYLLWAAKKRGLAGAGLWTTVPFYLAAAEDPEAWKKPLVFFDTRFDLGIDFTDLDENIARQNDKVARARSESYEIDDYMRRMESNLVLTEEDIERLTAKIEEYLRGRD